MKNNVCKKNIIHIHQLGFPINLEIIIPKDDSVRTLYEVTEGLDYSKLYEAYSTEGRNPMILPETLFRIVAYGYMEGIYSSRKLEKACKRDINFRWLLQGQKEPSHNTIARFRSKRLEGCVEDLFSQFIIELEKRNEIEFENLFVDGTKIEANANRYSFVWKKATDKFEEKLQNKTHKILLNISSELDLNLSIPDEKISVEYALAVKDKLIEIKEKEGLDFVYGKGKRKSKLQKYTEVINDFIEKQSKYDEYNKIFNLSILFLKNVIKFFHKDCKKYVRMNQKINGTKTFRVFEGGKIMIEKTTKIGELLEIAPEKANILLDAGMHCLGCPASQAETLEEACMVHGIDVEELLEKLNS